MPIAARRSRELDELVAVTEADHESVEPNFRPFKRVALVAYPRGDGRVERAATPGSSSWRKPPLSSRNRDRRAHSRSPTTIRRRPGGEHGSSFSTGLLRPEELDFASTRGPRPNRRRRGGDAMT